MDGYLVDWVNIWHQTLWIPWLLISFLFSNAKNKKVSQWQQIPSVIGHIGDKKQEKTNNNILHLSLCVTSGLFPAPQTASLGLWSCVIQSHVKSALPSTPVACWLCHSSFTPVLLLATTVRFKSDANVIDQDRAIFLLSFFVFQGLATNFCATPVWRPALPQCS